MTSVLMCTQVWSKLSPRLPFISDPSSSRLLPAHRLCWRVRTPRQKRRGFQVAYKMNSRPKRSSWGEKEGTGEEMEGEGEGEREEREKREGDGDCTLLCCPVPFPV